MSSSASAASKAAAVWATDASGRG